MFRGSQPAGNIQSILLDHIPGPGSAQPAVGRKVKEIISGWGFSQELEGEAGILLNLVEDLLDLAVRDPIPHKIMGAADKDLSARLEAL